MQRTEKHDFFIRGFMYLQVQTGGMDAETRKNHDFLSGALCICRCKQAAWTQRPEKNLYFLSGASFCRCRQAAWTQRPEKPWLFIRGFILQVQTGGVDAETRKKPLLFFRGFILQVQTGGVDAETGKNHLSVYNSDRSLSGVIDLAQVKGKDSVILTKCTI